MAASRTAAVSLSRYAAGWLAVRRCASLRKRFLLETPHPFGGAGRCRDSRQRPAGGAPMNSTRTASDDPNHTNPTAGATMRAIAAPGYGPLANLARIDLPIPLPRSHQIRVRVAATSLNPADYKVVLGTMKLLHARRRPLVLGYDFSGVVDAVGAAVKDHRVGDEVFGFLPYGPFNAQGAFAEFIVANEREVAKKPSNVPHLTAAAAATTGLTTIQALRDLGKVHDGSKVLITGVSGAVGSIAIGIARKLGAQVAAVGSGAGLDRARALGATTVLDRTALKLPDGVGEQFDVVFDAAAAFRWKAWRGTLKPGGAFVTTLPSGGFVADKLRSLFSTTRVHFIAVKSRRTDLELLGSWLDAGLEVPLAPTIDVKDVAEGLGQLQRRGGKIAVRVEGGF
ncbi:MAG: NAD(P)-dependent alcohol dehydrogenase [Kofleriaceae bacterium]